MKKVLLVLLIISLIALPSAGCAKPPLSFGWIEPKDGAVVTNPMLDARGTVSDGKATVWVNDTIVTVSKTGYYSTKVELVEGENTISLVAAWGKAGKWKEVISRTVIVTYRPPDWRERGSRKGEHYLENVEGTEPVRKGYKFFGSDKAKEIASWIKERHTLIKQP